MELFDPDIINIKPCTVVAHGRCSSGVRDTSVICPYRNTLSDHRDYDQSVQIKEIFPDETKRLELTSGVSSPLIV